jgi:MFS family permease
MTPSTYAATTAPRHQPGTVRSALANRDFRILWFGSFASNIGTWMQNVTLGVYANTVSHGSAKFVGLIVLCQLGPLLFSPIGGVFADRFPRRPFLMSCQAEQMVFSFVLAGLAAAHPSKLAVALVVLAVGVGNALNAPAWSAALPAIVGRDNLQGAISLNSTMVNGSRVIGPVVVAVLSAFGVTTAGIFAINAVTYLFVIGALTLVAIPNPRTRTGEGPLTQLLGGFREARRNRLAGRILTILPLFSLLCLPFVGLFSIVAKRNFGLNPKGTTYPWLYATWGLGACLGGLSIATVFAHVDKRRMTRWFLYGFAISLGAFAVVRRSSEAFPVGFLLGFCYFGATTAMLTVLQQHIRDGVRGRIMALWFMGFGGAVAVTQYPSGWLMDRFSVTPVLLVGAGAALLLGWFANLAPLSDHVRALGLAAD